MIFCLTAGRYSDYVCFYHNSKKTKVDEDEDDDSNGTETLSLASSIEQKYQKINDDFEDMIRRSQTPQVLNNGNSSFQPMMHLAPRVPIMGSNLATQHTNHIITPRVPLKSKANKQTPSSMGVSCHSSTASHPLFPLMESLVQPTTNIYGRQHQ
eukprot:Sdes_comp19238_c0_seq1m10166